LAISQSLQDTVEFNCGNKEEYSSDDTGELQSHCSDSEDQMSSVLDPSSKLREKEQPTNNKCTQGSSAFLGDNSMLKCRWASAEGLELAKSENCDQGDLLEETEESASDDETFTEHAQRW
jgi:hypothetical protein